MRSLVPENPFTIFHEALSSTIGVVFGAVLANYAGLVLVYFVIGELPSVGIGGFVLAPVLQIIRALLALDEFWPALLFGLLVLTLAAYILAPLFRFELVLAMALCSMSLWVAMPGFPLPPASRWRFAIALVVVGAPIVASLAFRWRAHSAWKAEREKRRAGGEHSGTDALEWESIDKSEEGGVENFVADGIFVDAPAQRVFAALLSPEDVREWMDAESVDVDARMGGVFKALRRDGSRLEGLISHFEPGVRLTISNCTWSLGDVKRGPMALDCTLDPRHGGIWITMRQDGLDSGPDWQQFAAATRKELVASTVALKRHIEGI